MLALAGRFPKLTEWEAGERQLAPRQLEDFVRAVHVAVGYLFLTSPLQASLPTPDFAQLRDTLLPKQIPGELRIADVGKFIERAEHHLDPSQDGDARAIRNLAGGVRHD